MGQLPRTISEGLKLLGVAEIAGRGSNRTILAWRDELNAAGVTISGYSDDDIPWCGLFAAIVAHRAGKVVPLKPLWARNWAKFGTLSVDAALGEGGLGAQPSPEKSYPAHSTRLRDWAASFTQTSSLHDGIRNRALTVRRG